MKEIFLLRHSYAVLDNTNDFDRVLTQEGIQKCEKLAKIIASYIEQIDHILCSPSTRTKQTIETILASLNLVKKITYEDELYGASAENILDLIRYNTPISAKSVLIISHNPGISEFGRYLAQYSDDMLDGFKPASLALFEAEIDSWQKLEPRNTKLINFWP